MHTHTHNKHTHTHTHTHTLSLSHTHTHRVFKPWGGEDCSYLFAYSAARANWQGMGQGQGYGRVCSVIFFLLLIVGNSMLINAEGKEERRTHYSSATLPFSFS